MAGQGNRLQGVRSVSRQLSIAETQIKRQYKTAMEIALRDTMAKAQKKTPVEFGVLVNSAFVQTARRASAIFGRMGYTAEYAPDVHEKKGTWKGRQRMRRGEFGPDPKGNYWDPEGEPKWLENAMFGNMPRMRSLIIFFMRRWARRQGG